MAHLIDTSVLARLANTADSFHVAAPQNLVAFRNMAIRPLRANGLGLSAAEAEAKSAVFETTFPLLVETPGIYPAWKALVGGLGILGKQVHDPRLVAICHVNSVTHVLAFNVSHFTRMAGFG